MQEYMKCIPQLNTIFSTLTHNEFEWVLASREQVIYTTPGVPAILGVTVGTPAMSQPWLQEILTGRNRFTKKMSGWRGDPERLTYVVGVPLFDDSGGVSGAFLYFSRSNNNADALLSLIQEMTREENLSTALNIFTRRTLDLFECSLVGIWLMDEGKYSLYSVSSRQREHISLLRDKEFPSDFGMNWLDRGVKECIESHPVIHDLSLVDGEWTLPFKNFGISRFICMPLFHFGQMLGATVLFGGQVDLLEEERVSWLKQVVPVVSSFVYEQQLRLASIDREQSLTLLLRGTEILVQADSEEQLLTEAGEMAMEILFLPGGFFLLADQEKTWQIRAPFGRLKQTEWDWETWVKQYIPKAQEISSYQHSGVHFLDVEDNPFRWERVLIQPLKTHSGVLGELWLMDDQKHATEQRQEILAAFVRIVGVALESIRQRDELARLASTDRLTGILNRQGFEQRIREEMSGTLRRETTFLVLVLDLDEFKQLNDTQGHPVGDQALKVIAQNLRSAVREEDIVARTGGDEFTVILTDIQRGEEAVQVVERMRKSMRLEEFMLGVSIGVAEFPTEGNDYEELYRLADQRLYQGKNAGKGKIIWN